MKKKITVVVISIIGIIILVLPLVIYRNETIILNDNDNSSSTTDKKDEETVTDDDTSLEDNSDDETIDISDSNQDSTSNKNDETTNSTNKEEVSNPDTNTNITDNTQNNTTTVEPEIETPQEKTLREQNLDLINEIQSIYGYRVSYGDEDFWYGGVASTKLTDEEKANKALKELKTASAIFPSGFFRTFQGYNGFRIILFEHINGAAGVASYEFGDDNLMAVDINSGFLGRVFYHETYHIMEQYIKYKTYNQVFPFDDWNSYNPADFNYGDTGIRYTGYDLGTSYTYDDPSLIAFVSEYAKTSPGEDRAELFADLMFRPIKKEYMYNGFAINEKAKKMALILRNYFPNSTGAYWERHISF